MQAAMEMGRSCVMFEINGMFLDFTLLSDKQYAGATQRMTEVFSSLSSQADVTTYHKDREIAYMPYFLKHQQVLSV